MKVYWSGRQYMNREGTLIEVSEHQKGEKPQYTLLSNDDLKTHNEKIARAAFRDGKYEVLKDFKEICDDLQYRYHENRFSLEDIDRIIKSKEVK